MATAKLTDLIPLQYTRRPTLQLAPDAMVFVNGSPLVTICNTCTKKVTLDDVMDISVSLNVDSSPGSATFNIATSFTGARNYFRFGRLVFAPMQEIEIFAKGRFAVGQQRDSRYYPIFWGFITSANYSYNGGVHTISIECKDILYWWTILLASIAPQLGEFVGNPEEVNKRFGKMGFFQKNPFEIIYALNNTMTGSAIFPALLTSLSVAGGSGSAESFEALNTDLISYWRQRFTNLQNGGKIIRSLKVLGMNGTPLTFDANGGIIFNSAVARNVTRQQDGQFPDNQQAVKTQSLDTDTAALTAPFLKEQFNSFQDFESNTITALEIADQVKRWIGYEFYMDVTGDLVFKPPFYNLDVRSNFPVSTVLDQDIISFSQMENSSEIVTWIDVIGSLDDHYQGNRQATPRAQFVDQHLARQFGIRRREVHMNVLRTKEACFAYAIQELARLNALRWKGSLTIPLRPELKLGFPVYIESLDTFYYVTGITHNLNFGETATTQLTLEAARRKYVAQDPPLTGSVIGAKLGPDGRLQGVPNRAMVFSFDPQNVPDPTQDNTKSLSVTPGAVPESKSNAQATTQQTTQTTTTQTQSSTSVAKDVPVTKQPSVSSIQKVRSQEKEGIQLNSKQGVWTEDTADTTSDVGADLQKRIGISDPDGYELVGGLPFGKNLSVEIDGQVNFVRKSNSAEPIFKKLAQLTPDNLEQNLLLPDADDSANAGTAGLSLKLITLGMEQNTPDNSAELGCDCSLQSGTISQALIKANKNRGQEASKLLKDAAGTASSVSNVKKGFTRLVKEGKL